MNREKNEILCNEKNNLVINYHRYNIFHIKVYAHSQSKYWQYIVNFI